MIKDYQHCGDIEGFLKLSEAKPLAGDKVEIEKVEAQVKDELKEIYKIKWQYKGRYKTIGEFSNKLSQKISDKIKQGYILDKDAQIEYIVKWRGKDEVLCKISMTKF